jgi:CcmD family protein
MYDFLEKNAMYIVLLIALIIWIGLFFYIFRLDKRIKKLEKEKNTE